MTQYDRRVSIINSLRPTSDGADALYRLIKLELLELGVFTGGDKMLDALARAGLAIAFRRDRENCRRKPSQRTRGNGGRGDGKGSGRANARHRP
jgi:hypothetical protein